MREHAADRGTAIHSPALLQGLGIPVAADRPVGENLLDHPLVGVLLHLRPAARVSTLMHRHTNCCLRGSSLAGALLSQGGPDAARGRLAVSVYQAFSRGHVRIASPDPTVDPAVEERMLSDERDLLRLRDGARQLQALRTHPAFGAIAERVE